MSIKIDTIAARCREVTFLVQPCNRPAYLYLQREITRLNGQETHLSRFLGHLAARIQVTFESLSLNDYTCVDSQPLRHYFLGPIAKAFSPLLGFFKSSFGNEISAISTTFHFLTDTFAEDDACLRLDLEAHNIAYDRVKAKANDFLHAFLLEAIAPQLGVAPTDCQSALRESIHKQAWIDFFLCNNKPLEIQKEDKEGNLTTIFLTREHLALLVSDIRLFASLLASTSDSNHKTPDGYTTAHLAALHCNWKALLLLKRKGADFSQKCRTGASVYDLLALQGCAKNSQITRIDDEEFDLSPQHSYIDLLRFWILQIDETMPKSLLSFEKPVYQVFQRRLTEENPLTPSLFINQDRKLCTKNAIRAGTFIITVPGELTTVNTSQYSHLHTINFAPHPFTNLLSYGPPNVCFVNVCHQGGLKLLCYAACDIPPGTPLTSPLVAKSTIDHAPSASFIETFIKETHQFTHFTVSKTPEGKRRAFFEDCMLYYLFSHPEILANRSTCNHATLFRFLTHCRKFFPEECTEVSAAKYLLEATKSTPSRSALLYHAYRGGCDAAKEFVRTHLLSFTHRDLPELIFLQHRLDLPELNEVVGALLQAPLDKDLAFEAKISRLVHTKFDIPLLAEHSLKTCMHNDPTSHMKEMFVRFSLSSSEWSHFIRAFRLSRLAYDPVAEAQLTLFLDSEGICVESLKEAQYGDRSNLLFTSIINQLGASLNYNTYPLYFLKELLWQDFLNKKNEPFTCRVGIFPNIRIVRVTRVHMAILLGAHDLLQAMLISPCLDEVDDRGFTAAHFAAMCGNWTALVLLQQAQVSFYTEAACEITPLDILKGQFPKKRSRDEMISALQCGPMSLTSLEELLNRTLIKDNLYTTGVHYMLWIHAFSNSTKDDFEDPRIQRAFTEFMENTPTPDVYIEGIPTGWQTVAGCDIQAGQLIGECTGNVRYIKDLIIDTKKYGNLMTYITPQEDPEKHLCTSVNVMRRGQIHSLIYALQDIPKGTPITRPREPDE